MTLTNNQYTNRLNLTKLNANSEGNAVVARPKPSPNRFQAHSIYVHDPALPGTTVFIGWMPAVSLTSLAIFTRCCAVPKLGCSLPLCLCGTLPAPLPGKCEKVTLCLLLIFQQSVQIPAWNFKQLLNNNMYTRKGLVMGPIEINTVESDDK